MVESGSGRKSDEAARVPLPAGYRQGIISAITVLLGFSLLFLRYWSFEAEGEWTLASILADLLLAVAILLEFFTLWRSLQPEDDDVSRYRITLRWFFTAIATLLLGLLLAGLTASRVVKF